MNSVVNGGIIMAQKQWKQSLQKFLEYQANNPDVKPLSQLPVYASMTSKPPSTLDDWPQGQLIVYPDFLVFLTLVEGNPGQVPLWKRVILETVEEMASLYRLKKIVDNPINIVTEIARYITGTYQHEDSLGKALANPNSIFVPLDEITHLSTGHSWRNGDHIKLSTADDNL
jgi:hypothetical protein